VQTIASNAGVEGAVIAGKLLEQENTDLGSVLKNVFKRRLILIKR